MFFFLLNISAIKNYYSANEHFCQKMFFSVNISAIEQISAF